MPWIIAIAATTIRPDGRLRTARICASAVAVVLLSAFSACGLRDYFAWNRARWQALDDLVTSGVPVNDIDGGFEFNRWHGHQTPGGDAAQRWMSKPAARYVVAFQPVEDLQVVGRYTYSHWMPPYSGTIFVLERSSH